MKKISTNDGRLTPLSTWQIIKASSNDCETKLELSPKVAMDIVN